MKIEYLTPMAAQKNIFAFPYIGEKTVKIIDNVRGNLIEEFKYQLEEGEDMIVLRWYISQRLFDIMTKKT